MNESVKVYRFYFNIALQAEILSSRLVFVAVDKYLVKLCISFL
jgi:hypothetical protein